MTTFTGGCVCGAVRYEVKAPPIMMFKCHCRTCQMVSGGGYTPVVLVPIKAFTLTQGTLKYYATQSIKDGFNDRGFCKECGSRISGAKNERCIGLTASSLDDPKLFKPQCEIFTDHAQPWDLIDSKLPQHNQYPQ